MIYLDSAATSFLKPPAVKTAMLNAMNSMSSPGRGAYGAAMNAAEKVYECRQLACRLFNFDAPENVVFTMNATHALNIAIKTLAHEGSRIVISGYEHNSVTRPLRELGADIRVAAGKLFDPRSVLGAFEKELNDGAELAVCNHVSNVFGFVQPIYEIADMCAKRGVPLIIDASQSAGIETLDALRLGAAFIAMPGHKGLLGPQGTGILLCSQKPEPIMCGGTGSESRVQTMPEYLPDRAEAGTHNVVGIAGLCEGIKYVLRITPERIGAYERSLCLDCANRLKRTPTLEVFSGSAGTQAGVLSFRCKKLDCETFCERLSERGIAARCGLHCAPLAHESAGTVETGTVRISFSPFISRRQAAKACAVIESIADAEI